MSEDLQKVECCRIVAGATYRYIRDLPVGCKDALYRVVQAEILDVPSYQKKVLVRGLTGKDAGLWFTCSLANFATRYERVKEPATPVAVERVADMTSPGKGF